MIHNNDPCEDDDDDASIFPPPRDRNNGKSKLMIRLFFVSSTPEQFSHGSYFFVRGVVPPKLNKSSIFRFHSIGSDFRHTAVEVVCDLERGMVSCSVCLHNTVGEKLVNPSNT